jgi:hypothetical protein
MKPQISDPWMGISWFIFKVVGYKANETGMRNSITRHNKLVFEHMVTKKVRGHRNAKHKLNI